MPAPVFDTTGSGQTGASLVPQTQLTTYTLAATLGVGASLVVSVHGGINANDLTTTVYAITYNGVSMSSLAGPQIPSSTSAKSQMFGLLNCGDGTSHNIVVSMSGTVTPSALIVGYISYTGVGGFSGGVSSNPGIATNSGNLAVTSSTNSVVVGAGAHGDTTTGAGTGGTSRWSQNIDSGSAGSNARGADWVGAASVNVAFTSGVSDNWTLLGVSVDGTAASASASPPVFGPGSIGPLAWQWQQITGASALAGGDLSVNAELTTVAVAAAQPTISIAVQPPAATVGLAAAQPTVSAGVQPPATTVAVVAQVPAASIKVNTAAATVVLVAYDATISTSTNLNVNAPVATVAIVATTPTVSIAVQAPVATVNVVALAPTAAPKPSAGLATVAVAANAPTPAIAVQAPVAPVNLAALAPTVSGSTTLNVFAELTTVALVAQTPGLSIKVNAAVATVAVAALTPGDGRGVPSDTVTLAALAPTISSKVNAEVAAVLVLALGVAMSGGGLTLPDTPAERIFRVLADRRIFTRPYDDRTFRVPPDPRIEDT